MPAWCPTCRPKKPLPRPPVLPKVMMAPRSKLAAAGAAVALVAGIAVLALPPPDNDGAKPGLGLFTSLPIFWAESENIADMLGSAVPPHWARTALEADHRLVPLDTLGRADL